MRMRRVRGLIVTGLLLIVTLAGCVEDDTDAGGPDLTEYFTEYDPEAQNARSLYLDLIDAVDADDENDTRATMADMQAHSDTLWDEITDPYRARFIDEYGSTSNWAPGVFDDFGAAQDVGAYLGDIGLYGLACLDGPDASDECEWFGEDFDAYPDIWATYVEARDRWI